jgi:hypothetical protein
MFSGGLFWKFMTVAELNDAGLILFPVECRMPECQMRVGGRQYRCGQLVPSDIDPDPEGFSTGISGVFGSGAMIAVGSRSVKDAERDLTIVYNVILNRIRPPQDLPPAT